MNRKKIVKKVVPHFIVAAFIIAGCVSTMDAPMDSPDIPQGLTMLDISSYYELTEVPGRISMVEFYSSYCWACLELDSVVTRLGIRYKGKVLIGKVDVQSDSTIRNAFSIDRTPTFLFLNSGKEIRRLFKTSENETPEMIEDSLIIIIDSLLVVTSSS